jgi:hypothetical protein
MKQIEAELERGYQKIDERTTQNERLSSELKQLKEMLPMKNTGMNMSVVIEDKHEINKDLVQKDNNIEPTIKKRYEDEGEELSDDLDKDNVQKPESDDSEPMPAPKKKGSSNVSIDEDKSEDNDNVINKGKDIVSPSNTVGL